MSLSVTPFTRRGREREARLLYPVRGVGQVLGDILSGDLKHSVISTSSRAHQNRMGTTIFSELNIGGHVANDEACAQVYVQLLSGSPQKEGFRFPTWAALRLGVRTEIDLINRAANGGRLSHHLSVNREELLLREVSQSDAGLIGDDDDPVPKVFKALEREKAAGDLGEAFRVAQIFDMLIDRAISIHKDRWRTWMRDFRSLTGDSGGRDLFDDRCC